MSEDDVCSFMGCKHPRKSHTFNGRCDEKKAFYNEVLYGYEQPLIYKTCLCTWSEPIPAKSGRRVKDNPQS